MIDKINKIIYDNCREVMNVTDKLNIAMIFIFSFQANNKLFADVLYLPIEEVVPNVLDFVNNLHDQEPITFDDISKNANNRNAFENCRKEIITKFDKDKFYKAVFEKDSFALSICDISDVIKKGQYENIRTKK